MEGVSHSVRGPEALHLVRKELLGACGSRSGVAWDPLAACLGGAPSAEEKASRGAGRAGAGGAGLGSGRGPGWGCAVGGVEASQAGGQPSGWGLVVRVHVRGSCLLSGSVGRWEAGRPTCVALASWPVCGCRGRALSSAGRPPPAHRPHCALTACWSAGPGLPVSGPEGWEAGWAAPGWCLGLTCPGHVLPCVSPPGSLLPAALQWGSCCLGSPGRPSLLLLGRPPLSPAHCRCPA